ncbi:MAG: hypothetical protein FWH03_02365 [Firmicutes bacterium]|nr:hypothetical protein [Bacillota bacterium]
MKKYLLYELKKNLLPLIILTVMAVCIYLIPVFTTTFYLRGYSRSGPLLAIPIAMLLLLTFIVPIIMFYFKMSARQTDCFYSMPLRREKVYLIKSVVGLILVLAPYTVSYWLGFIATITKPNLFIIAQFIPPFFIGVVMAVCLFGFNAFIFTRANHVVDGIFFMLLYSFATMLFMAYLGRHNFMQIDGRIFLGARFGMLHDYYWWFSGGPLALTAFEYTFLTQGHGSAYFITSRFAGLYYAVFAVLGVAAWAGLFLTARKEKAENAGRVSDSWFGYRALMPYYLTFGLALVNFRLTEHVGALICIPIFLVAALILYFIFRRSVKLKRLDLICLAAALLVGVALSFTPLPYRPPPFYG